MEIFNANAERLFFFSDISASIRIVSYLRFYTFTIFHSFIDVNGYGKKSVPEMTFRCRKRIF